MFALRLGSLFLVCLFTILTCPAALAAPATVTGQVVDGDGQPVPGAHVWLIRSQWPPTDSELVQSSVADDAGGYSLTGLDHIPSTERDSHLIIAAYREGVALGWGPLGEGTSRVVITCPEPAPVPGRIVSTDGRPVSAQIEPDVVADMQLEPFPPWYCVPVPREVAQKLAVRTQPDGTFLLSWRPPGTHVGVRFSAAGYGQGSAWRGDLAGPFDIVLAPPGAVRGRLVCEEHAELVRGVTIECSSGHWDEGLYYQYRARTDAEGWFEFPEVQPGTARISVKLGPSAQWRAGRREAEVKSGETTEVEIDLRRALPVSGRVVEDGTGDGVSGAVVRLSGTSVTTDIDGRYVIYALPGKNHVVLGALPPAYASVGLGTQIHEVIVEDGRAIAPDFTAKPAVTVDGHVVDSAGKPVPAALVYCDALVRDIWWVWAIADDQGKFRIGRLDPDVSATLFAWRDDLMSLQPTSMPANAQQPVTLTVHRGVGARVRVSVSNDKQQPVAGAVITAHCLLGEQGDLALRLGKTDERGIFQGAQIWPFGTHLLRVEAVGHTRIQTWRWTASPRETHDFGSVVLKWAAGVISGRVLDPQRQPVIGATVFNHTIGPESRRVRTRAQGCFRLEGLFDGEGYIFATAPGYFTAAVWAKVGQDDTRLAMVQMPERTTLAVRPPVQPLTDEETDLRIAQDLIDEALGATALLPAGDRTAHSLLYRLLPILVRLDADRALDVSADHGGRYDGYITEAVGRHLIHDNPDVALGYLLSTEEPRELAQRHLWAGQQLADTDPGMAQNLLERAIECADAVASERAQVELLAKAGDALWQIDPKAAEPVLRRAAQQARDLDDGEFRVRLVIGIAAEALCLVDLDAGLQLLERVKTGGNLAEYHRRCGNVAARLAPTDAEEAAKLLRSMPIYDMADAVPRVARAMAPADYERAMRLAEDAESRGNRARAFAYIAEALVEEWPERAGGAFDRALATLREAEGQRIHSGATGMAKAVAELAEIGARIGYGHIEELCWEALSWRPSEEHSFGLMLDDGTVATCLAFVRPRLALDFIRHSIASDLPTESDPYLTASWYEKLCRAAAIADARAAAAIVHLLPERLPNDDRLLRLECCIAVADVLTTPRDRRRAEMLKR